MSSVAVEQLERVRLKRLERTSGWPWADFTAATERDPRADTLFEALQHCAHFGNVNSAVLKQLAETATIHRYRKHQILFIEGDLNRTLYFILSGSVKVYQLSRDGRERIAALRGSGDFSGAISFADGGTYPVSAEVLEDAEIATFRWDEFHAIARDDASVWLALLEVTASQLRQAQADMQAFALHSAPARLAGKLLDLADAFGKVNDVGIELELELNREQLGSLVGTSRETTTRVLRQFEEEQVIKLDGPKVTIVKPFILQALSED